MRSSDANRRASALLTYPQPGELLGEKYRIDRTLGRGGMGVVVAATDVELERPVAIKFLLPELLTESDVVSRFLREARAAASIESEHVARLFELGRLPDDVPYMVMEYLQGEDLACVLDRTQGPLDTATASSYVLQACHALVEAHAKGIVHRDLKPPNLFLAGRPDGSSVVKVLDFGISKLVEGAGGGRLTQSGTAIGSPYYMSPEQVASADEVDGRSDIWSLGVILYELLNGVPPFTGPMPAVLMAIHLQAPASLASARPELPPELCALVHRCLEKDPAARFQTVSELAAALAPFSGRSETAPVDRIVRSGNTEVVPSWSIPPEPASSSVSAGLRKASWHARLSALTVLALAIAAFALGWAWWVDDEPEAPATVKLEDSDSADEVDSTPAAADVVNEVLETGEGPEPASVERPIDGFVAPEGFYEPPAAGRAEPPSERPQAKPAPAKDRGASRERRRGRRRPDSDEGQPNQAPSQRAVQPADAFDNPLKMPLD